MPGSTRWKEVDTGEGTPRGSHLLAAVETIVAVELRVAAESANHGHEDLAQGDDQNFEPGDSQGSVHVITAR